MSGWFEVGALADGVWQLTEPGHVCSWLVAGQRRAALIDTGCGFAPIRPVVESLTDLEVVVVQTHHHLDHIGGTWEFDEVLIHPAGVAGLAMPVPDEVCAAYLRYAAELVAAYDVYRVLDERFFHLLEDHHRVRALPPTARAGAWRVAPARATGTIDEGDVVELGGGRALSVLCSHFLRTEVPPAYLARQVEAFDALLRGEVALRPAVDCIGTPVMEAAFDGFGVLVPEGWTAPHAGAGARAREAA